MVSLPMVGRAEAPTGQETADGESGALLSPTERAIATALAEAVIPATRTLPGGGLATATRLEQFAARAGAALTGAIRSGLWVLELSTLPTTGRRFSALDVERRRHALARFGRSDSRRRRLLLKAMLVPLKLSHFDDRAMFELLGCRYELATPLQPERERWMTQITDGGDVDEDLRLDCEIVVVGTGAGGAAAAHELAKRGRAVLMLEAGNRHDRSRFNGRSHYSFTEMYLGKGMTIAWGNVGAPVWAGRAVGGSTVINSGTCYRVPSWVLERWAARYGLGMLAGTALNPYFESVEAMLEVAEAPRAHLGGPARVVARGAEALGLSHGPLRRNAPGCDGQGVCCFGCPTGAKRSTDVSYVPAALERGAQLVTGAHVERVDTVAGRARGVTARLASGHALKVRAEAVVVAGGALLTPLLLERSGAARASGWLGRNLSIHPASRVMALFDEDIDMSRGIPQSYTIDEYHREGLMFEGGSTPLDVTAASIPFVGDDYSRTIEQYRNLAQFGFMIQDTSRGRVRRGVGGLPFIRYDLNRRDTTLMQRGIQILSEVFLRAGARRVLPMVHGMDAFDDEAGLRALRQLTLRPGDFEVTAYHPLGTCRMGTDPGTSCVGPDGEVHDTAGLYVADGSVMPSSLGVNPQMTIMALALRTAEGIDARFD